MKYIFGPVFSRRLGHSLGIDPIPSKTCTWNCIYCQLGKTKNYSLERKEYVPTNDLMDELKNALAAHAPGEIDWITFVGSGEPTLHNHIGDMIRQTKSLTDIPVAVITNGSLLYLPKVREALLAADAVLPTLTAGSAELYKKINRPHQSLDFDSFIQGLKDFRKIYRGKFWVEVMLISGLNDSIEALQDLADVLRDINPDAVHLVLPTRPPSENWVSLPDQQGLMRAQAILSGIAELVNPSQSHFELHDPDNLYQEILGILERHPMMHTELAQALTQLGKTEPEMNALFSELQNSGEAETIEQHGVQFWIASSNAVEDQ